MQTSKILWSPELAYSVGCIVADGLVSANGTHIELLCKNYEQIKMVKDFLSIREKIRPQYDGKIGIGKPKYHLRWKDAQLNEFLIGIGFRPYKELSLGALKIPDTYFFEFLRGYQDSDTCFSSYFDMYWKENNLFFVIFATVTREHAIWLQETIYRLIGARGFIARTGKSAKMSKVKFAKNEAVILLSRLQLSSSVVPPNRKRLKITRALSMVGLPLEQT